jgi:TusA-related sulfurtransferase
MEEKNINSQVIDLQNEKCPYNLVKFKFYFYELKKFKAIVKKGEASEGIVKFLQHKNANFELNSHDNYNIFDIK